MSIKIVKERQQTGEDWIIYEVTVPCSWDWINGIIIEATWIDNRIDLTKPVWVTVT